MSSLITSGFTNAFIGANRYAKLGEVPMAVRARELSKPEGKRDLAKIERSTSYGMEEFDKSDKEIDRAMKEIEKSQKVLKAEIKEETKVELETDRLIKSQVEKIAVEILNETGEVVPTEVIADDVTVNSDGTITPPKVDKVEISKEALKHIANNVAPPVATTGTPKIYISTAAAIMPIVPASVSMDVSV